MKIPEIIIAIDGHSSTGKSTFARLAASELGFIYVDTGALYRGITLFAIKSKYIDLHNNVNENALREGLENLACEFRFSEITGGSELWVNGECVEKDIRSLEVSARVSIIATIGFVRDYVDNILHDLGKKRGVVMDGRDIGTVVFPDAELKIFMTARPEVRAKRRYDEMKAAGENPDYEKILENVNIRDTIDQNREIAPLKMAPDAILLDNSEMTVDEQLIWLNNLIEKRWNSK
jgi:cytidylate kinase